MRIVITRAAERAGTLEDELRAAGLAVDFLPLTEQRLVADVAELRRAVERLRAGEFSWLLITSATTVRMLAAVGWTGEMPDGTRLGVTGPATARALAEHTGVAEIWTPSGEASAAGMLAELPSPEPGERLLLPQSALARPRLRDGLVAAGWEVAAVTAYETVSRLVDGVPPEGVPRLEADDVVLITSSSAARAWVELVDGAERRGDELAPAQVLAIGRPTARTLEELEAPADVVLDEPTADGVRRALG